MESLNNIKLKDALMSEQDKKTISALVQDLQHILENPKINEDLLKRLWNIENSVESLRENYMWRILRTAKQNHMLD